MTLSLRPAFRRAIALFILAALLFFAWTALIGPTVASYAERQYQIEETRYQLGKFEVLAARKDGAEQQLERATAAYASRGEFLREETPALASANLQTRLRAIVSANGAVMSAARTIPAKQRDGFQAVTLRITLTGDLDAVKKTMHKIEANVPYLIIDNLDLKPSRIQGAPQFISLDASFDVIGFLNSGGGA